MGYGDDKNSDYNRFSDVEKHYVPCAELDALLTVTCVVFVTVLWGWYFQLYFTDKETEAQPHTLMETTWITPKEGQDALLLIVLIQKGRLIWE